MNIENEKLFLVDEVKGVYFGVDSLTPFYDIKWNGVNDSSFTAANMMECKELCESLWQKIQSKVYNEMNRFYVPEPTPAYETSPFHFGENEIFSPGTVEMFLKDIGMVPTPQMQQ